MPWGEWGEGAFLEPSAGKPREWRVLSPAQKQFRQLHMQAEEKEIALRFMNVKFISFVFFLLLFTVSVRPGILTIPN